MKTLVRHGQPGAIVEIVEIEAERTVGLDIDQVVANDFFVFRRSVGCKPHQFVLARIDLEAGIVCEGRVEQTQAVRKVDLLPDLKVFSFADGNRSGGPFAHAIEREDGSFVKRRWVECGGCVAQMMLTEFQALRPVEIGLD